MLDSALDAALYLELWEEAAEYGRQGLLGYKHYLPHYHPLLGCHLLVQGKLEKFLERDPRQVLSLLEEACEILGVTHGKGHSFCHTEAYPLLHDTQAMVHSLMSGQLPPPSTVTS
ncbi:unnamed protein product [Cyprideis torosa]|uniref:Uncharacterized protein n=1 Tax=Cyprideis torosa TaxID=163714 RepID=A0A7R8WBF4_9CRUS|nr:unnamed protein product [Cyprideis torosa]CAG0886371.1 unnamed protein product [Cyprideis torosa]